MEGVDGLIHIPAWKKKTSRILKKLLHILWFSAPHCKSLSFTQQKEVSRQLGLGSASCWK